MVSLSYDRSISISSIYSTILCYDLNMPISKEENILYPTDEIDWTNHFKRIKNTYYCPLLMHEYLQHLIPRLTDKKLRSLVHWAIEGNDRDIKEILVTGCLSYLTDGEHRFLVKWYMEEQKPNDLLYFSKNCFPYLTNEERQPIIDGAMKEKGYSYAKLQLLENSSYLTQDEYRELVLHFIAYSSFQLQLLKICFSKTTPPTHFNAIIELIKEPFLKLQLTLFYEVVKKADAGLVVLFLEKYHQNLTDEQFAMMIRQVGTTIQAGRFLQNHSSQLLKKPRRFSLVITMCSTYEIVTFLGEHRLTLEQRQVIEEREGPFAL
jgi:hypothetical protein